MPDFDKLLRPNPFAGDRGELEPQLAQAFALEPGEVRVSAIVAALGRVLLAVHPHEHPGTDAQGRVLKHETSPDPLDSTDDALFDAPYPGGKRGVEVFSSVAALRLRYPVARPVPAAMKYVARAALTRADGVAILDPGLDTQVYLGRSAMAALATSTEWVAPWADRAFAQRLVEQLEVLCEVRELPFSGHDFQLVGSASGLPELRVFVGSGAGRKEVEELVDVVAELSAHDDVLRARVELLQVVPYR